MAFNQPMSKRRALNNTIQVNKSNNRVSKFESLSREYLEFYYKNEDVIYNYRPDWLKNPKTGYNLEIDIFYPKLKFGLEVNGATHSFEYQQYKDNVKKEICSSMGINLISITHPTQLFRLNDKLGLIGEVNKSLYNRIKYYKASKKAFGSFKKRIVREKRRVVARDLQDKERQFNREKMLREKSS